MDLNEKVGVPYSENMIKWRWPLTISMTLLSLILIICLSFAVNASHANKRNDPVMQYHRTGLGWIVTIIIIKFYWIA